MKGLLPLLFHPAYVHFPIAFFFLETGLWIAWLLKGGEEHRRFAALAFRWGYVLMLMAMVTGFLHAGGLAGIDAKVRPHFYSALALFVFYTLRAVYSYCVKDLSRHSGYWQTAGALTGIILVTVTAFFGGRLV